MTNKFNVGDSIKYIGKSSQYFTRGKKYKLKTGEFCDLSVIDDCGSNHDLTSNFINSDFQLATSKQTKNQRIAKLEEEVAELKLIVEQIRKPSPLVSAASIIALGADEPKTANQLRAEIIEKAKGFVEDNLTKNHPGAYFATTGRYIKTCAVTFHVNTEKRTVVALVHSVVDKTSIRFKGIAKCDPSDVFNEHIGKAIALGRALGLDVSEFEQAVQPNELVIGMKGELLKQLKHRRNSPGAIKTICTEGIYPEGGPNCAIDSVVADNCRIVNDTNAQYEVNK